MSQVAGPVAPPLEPGETALLDIERSAVLATISCPPRSGLHLGTVRVTGSLGVDEEVTRHRAAVENGRLEQAVAQSARLMVTDRAVLVIQRDGDVWRAGAADLADVVHSASEPCTVFARRDGAARAVLVPVAEAPTVDDLGLETDGDAIRAAARVLTRVERRISRRVSLPVGTSVAAVGRPGVRSPATRRSAR